MGTVVLVTGGARSGKSLFAVTLTARLGACVAYVAMAEVYDAEMDTHVIGSGGRPPGSPVKPARLADRPGRPVRKSTWCWSTVWPSNTIAVAS
jgi:hypothetical protein